MYSRPHSTLAAFLGIFFLATYVVGDEPSAIVSATPAAIRLDGSKGYLWTQPDYVCADFYIRADREPISQAIVTSTGFGQATLSPMSRNPKCSQRNPGENVLLRMPLTQNSIRI